MTAVNDAGKPKQDRLSKRELAARYGFAVRVIYSDPEIRALFERALDASKGQWTQAKFMSKLQDTKWYRSNSEYFRKAWAAEKTGGQDWKTQLETARNTVARRAAVLGATLRPRQLEELTQRYLYEGWFDGPRREMLDSALAQYAEVTAGESARRAAEWREAAFNYGITLDDAWINKANRSIIRGESTSDTWDSEIRDRAKQRFAPIADRIDRGETTREALSDYLAAMSDILEIRPQDVDLNDRLIRRAMGAEVNDPEKGQTGMMSVFDFEAELRKDPRWKQTGNGRRAHMELADELMRSFGFKK